MLGPNTGRKLSKKWKGNISKSLRGEKNPWFGKHFSKKMRAKISERTIEAMRRPDVILKLSGERSSQWKGGLGQYRHAEARRLFGKPYCEECGITYEEYFLESGGKKFDMHCVSKDYRIMEQWNWKCLCKSCHMREPKEKRRSDG